MEMSRHDISQLSLFSGLNSNQLTLITPLLDTCNWAANQVIFQQGQSADFLFFLQSGEVSLHYKPYDGPPLTLTKILPGGIFGWSSALGKEEYSASAFSIKKSTAYRLRGDELHFLCENHPETGIMIIEYLVGIIAQHLDYTQEQMTELLSQGLEANNLCGKEVRKR
jgi:CRP-like cAMP-binding protein